jgi:hypothetical protein
MDSDLVSIIDSAKADMVVNFCGIFVLSNGDSAECVTLDVKQALCGDHDFRYIDCFPKDGGGRLVYLRRVDFDDQVENLSYELRREQEAMNRLYEQGFRWSANL